MTRPTAFLRRAVLSCALAFALAPAALQAETGEDGLHKQPWFETTLRDIRDDIAAAAEEDKTLVLVFEQRGCVYCARMHENILSDPEAKAFIEQNFMVVQYNLFGDEGVTDLDGEELTEKTAARKWGVNFTPMILFMPDKAPEEKTSAARAAVASLPGGFGKITFLNMFKWVEEKGYEGEEHFQKYHARKIEEMRKAGVKLDE